MFVLRPHQVLFELRYAYANVLITLSDSSNLEQRTLIYNNSGLYQCYQIGRGILKYIKHLDSGAFQWLRLLTFSGDKTNSYLLEWPVKY